MRVEPTETAFWPPVLALSALVAVATYNADLGPLRVLAACWFLVVCPGMSFVPLLGIEGRGARVALAVAISVAVDTIVAESMIYGHVWSPALGLLVIVVVTLVGAGLQVWRRLHHGRFHRLPMSRALRRRLAGTVEGSDRGR